MGVSEGRMMIILVLTVIHTSISAQFYELNTQGARLKNLPQNYDSKSRPHSGQSVSELFKIEANGYLRAIDEIDENDMAYRVDFVLRMRWIDERLRLNQLGGDAIGDMQISLSNPRSIWGPDVFFPGMKDGKLYDTISPNFFTRFNTSSSEVHQSMRLSMTMGCPMDFSTFPFDRHSCKITIASYGYTDDNLVFRWKEMDNPIQTANRVMRTTRFTFETVKTETCKSKTVTGSYSCLNLKIYFRRNSSYHVFHYFVPSCVLLALSWMSLWVDQRQVLVRLTLVLTAIVGIGAMFSRVHAEFPRQSRTTALDTWLGFDMLLAVVVLMEFALVHYLARNDEDDENPIPNDEETSGAKAGGNGAFDVKIKTRKNLKKWLGSVPNRSRKIDRISKILLPLVFAIFNLIYWIAYLTKDTTLIE